MSSVSVRRLIAFDETMSDITGSASGSTLVMTGGSSSGGTFRIALATFSRTSLAASLMSRSSTKRTVICARPFGDARLDLVDPRDAADRLLHRLDDRGRHLVRARAGQRQGDADGRRIGLREQVDAEAAEREDAEHHQRHHEHRGEDRAADAEIQTARRPPVIWSTRDEARRRPACRRR